MLQILLFAAFLTGEIRVLYSLEPPQTCGGNISYEVGDVKLSRFNSMTELYKKNREEGIPNYVTLDYVLTYYNLFERKAVRDMEQNLIIPKFNQFVDRLYDLELKKYERADNATKASYRGLIAYLSVIKKLKDPGFKPISAVAALVDSELQLIRRHQGIQRSATLLSLEDFSQYVPRGYYTQSEELKRYFLASLYASRMKFYLKDSRATGIDSSIADWHTFLALELSGTINNDKKLKQLYSDLMGYYAMLVGPVDDLTPLDLAKYIGQRTDVRSLRHMIWLEAKSSRRPRIISEYVDRYRLEPGLAPEDVVIGMRLLPQRIMPDAVLFQWLVYDKVREYTGNNTPFTMSIINNRRVRGFPRGFDLLAALGNWKALNIMNHSGDTDYKNYDVQFKIARDTLTDMLARSSSWYANDLQILRLVSFQCPSVRGVNTGLGFWILSRYNYILYGKQSYTVGEKGFSLGGKERNTAYLDPSTDVYMFIGKRVRNMARYITDKNLKENAERFAGIMDKFVDISLKEKMKSPLTRDEVELLNNIDMTFSGMFGKDAPIVIDVHTEPNSKLVLQEAIGKPFEVNLSYRGYEYRGALFSVYEFKQPMANRLDDQKWKNSMRNYKPVLPLDRGEMDIPGR